MSTLWRRRSMLMVYKKRRFPSVMATNGANGIHRENSALNWQFQWRICQNQIPLDTTQTSSLAVLPAHEINQCFFHNILHMLKMFWLCKIHYTKNFVNLKSLPQFDFYILVCKMLCFTVFLWLWINALNKYLAAAKINLMRILNCASCCYYFTPAQILQYLQSENLLFSTTS